MRPSSLVPILTFSLLTAALYSNNHELAHAQEPEHVASTSAPQRQESLNETTGVTEGVSATQSTKTSDFHHAVIFTFGVLSSMNSGEITLSAKACSAAGKATEASTGTTEPPTALDVDPKILSGITDELQNRLSKKMSVTVDAEPREILVNSLVITGCITRIDAGNGAKRLIGMNLGASHLRAHIIVLSKTNAGFSTVDSFDIQVRGGDALPPLGPVGLAIHAAREPAQTLSADARKLADQLLKKLAKDQRSHDLGRGMSG